jgi:flagellar biosynthesis protein FlhA
MNTSLQALLRPLGRHGDVVLVLLVVGVLAILFAPIPPRLLDFLLVTNFSLALLVLLLTFYVRRPVEFSTFPSLLLIATLFRLSLNVATTRLILTEAEAGHVIDAVGAHVVGGNYVVGLIVFIILVVVQYVVVTSGAQRVSEVAARFTLDSMPGQQMSIDADLNMGFIDQKEAMRRRRALEQESSFYGAMDGASKFVKGDAIAGILILLVNIIGGLVLGVMQQGMSWAEALQRYTLLTIGDGIVTQVPALVISVGTGIIVTRSGSDGYLSREVFAQVTSSAKALGLVLLALLVLALVPGLPAVPLLALALLFAAATWAAARRPAAAGAGADGEGAAQATAGAAAGAAGDGAAGAKDAWPDLHPVELRLGATLAGLAREPAAQALSARIDQFRRQFLDERGMALPPVRVASVARLPANGYELAVFGVPVGKGELLLDKTLAIHVSGDTRSIPGVVTREPTYGLPAVWVGSEHRDAARAAKFTLVDPETVLMTHLGELLRQQAATLLTRAETDKLLQRVRDGQPGLVEEFIPTLLSVGDVQKVLQSLLREKVSIRHLDAICETLADVARHSKDVPVLADAVRQRLGPSICQALVGDAAALQVLTLEPTLEQHLAEAARGGPGAAPAGLDPRLAEQLVAQMAASVEQMMKSNLMPVLLCAQELRRHVKALSERTLPHLVVLGLAEVPNSVPLKSFGVVALRTAAAR